MTAQGYGRHIQEQIRNWPSNEPITTAAVATGLVDAFGINIDDAKKVTNVNMKRLVEKGEIERVQKGVYGKVKITPFGRLAPCADEIIERLLLQDGGKTIGYITGPTLLNAIGLCSWMPRERHIATNDYRRLLPAEAPIRTYKPAVTVDDENAPYLRAIAAFDSVDKYPVDAEKPNEILRVMLKQGHIDNEKLILFARKHYGHKTLLKTIDIALGGI